MSKHVLVVGGFIPLHKRLKQLGARMTLMMTTSGIAENIKGEDAAIYDRIFGIPAKASPAECVRWARLLHESDPVDAVGAYSEMNQDIAAAVAQDLGLPFHTPTTVRAVRNKYQMRLKLHEAGLDETPFERVKTPEEISAFAEAYGYPLILKPVDGWASVGVSAIRDELEIAAALRWFQTWAGTYEMYVERFIDGEEFSVEAFSADGQHRILCMTKKFKEQGHFVEVGHCVPAGVDSRTDETVGAFVSHVLTALGIRQGPSHTEIILTAHGPRVVETHTRMAGDFVPDLVQQASGIDMADLWVRQTLGEPVMRHLPLNPEWHSFAAIWFVTPEAEGTLDQVLGEPAARSLPGVVRVAAVQSPGTVLTGMGHSFCRTAYSIATGPSVTEAVSRARESTEMLQFAVSCHGRVRSNADE